jgi:phosphohistidine phosphatase
MRLLIVRHAIAEERQDFHGRSADDALRPLTADGAAKMRRGARGLRQLVPELEVLSTSPLVRARQTAEILAEAYPGVPIEVAEPLAPGHPPAEALEWLRRRRVAAAAAVGHEPGLSFLASWLIAAGERSALELKKGAACLVDLPRLAAGAGTLLWLAPPRMLRRFGESAE